MAIHETPLQSGEASLAPAIPGGHFGAVLA